MVIGYTAVWTIYISYILFLFAKKQRFQREGDSLAEGVRVESITPEGAVLSYHGSRFLLPRQ